MNLLYFPRMHLEFVTSKVLLKKIYFLDPGVQDQAGQDINWYRPEKLPMQSGNLKKYIEQAVGFGQNFKDPVELEYFLGTSWEDFFSNTAMGIRKEISDYNRTGALRPWNWDNALLQAQIFLGLAWDLEQKLLELENLNKEVLGKWSNLYAGLGVEREEEAALELGKEVSVAIKEDRLPQWNRILPWFLLFMPESWSLLFEDLQIMEDLKEYGLFFKKIESLNELGFKSEVAKGKAGKVMSLEELGWKLCLFKSPSEEMPWLNKSFKMIYWETY